MSRSSSAWYKYTADDGRDYRIWMRTNLGELAELEPGDGLPLLPSAVRARYIWLEEKHPIGPSFRKIRRKVFVQSAKTFPPGRVIVLDGVEMRVTCYQGESESGRRNKERQLLAGGK